MYSKQYTAIMRMVFTVGSDNIVIHTVEPSLLLSLPLKLTVDEMMSSI